MRVSPGLDDRAVVLKSRPELEVKLAPNRREHKAYLQRTRLLSSAESFETRARLGVDAIGETGGPLLAVGRGPKLAEERLRGDARDLAARGAQNGRIGRDDHDTLAVAVLGGEALEERVGVRRV